MAASFIAVTIERLIAFARSAKESRAFAQQAGKLLEEWKVDEIVRCRRSTRLRPWRACLARSSAATSTPSKTWVRAVCLPCSWPAAKPHVAKEPWAKSCVAA